MKSIKTDSDKIKLVDLRKIISQKSQMFYNTSHILFSRDNHLWQASALRFFLLEDFLDYYNIENLFHVEGDNLLYGNLSEYFAYWMSNYKSLAATPVSFHYFH